LVTKKEISLLGMQRDRKRRILNAREDTHYSLEDIETARKSIYGKSGYKVNSKAVEDVLQPTSRVPTVVSY
jgi:hypothetical protein